VRTDLTYLCPRCSVRFSPAVRCPRRDSRCVYDLRRARWRKKAFEVLENRETIRCLGRLTDRADRLVIGYVRFGFVGLCVTAALVTWVSTPKPATALTAAVFAAFAQILLAVAALGVTSLGVVIGSALGRLVARGRAPPPSQKRKRVAPLSPPMARDAPGQVRVAGTVRVTDPVPPPLGGAPCAAFRLVGEAPGGLVDDAALTSFEVLGDGGKLVVVQGKLATVMLDIPSPPRVVRPDTRLTRFLEDRGVFPEREPLRLAEAVLVSGDRVVVMGRGEEALRGEGYRGALTTLVMRDARDGPLVTRRG
jgi:uncharacterized membrane protein